MNNSLNDVMCMNKDCLNLVSCYCQSDLHNITPSSSQCDINKCLKFVGKKGE
jgi:hypothetical protein